MACLGRTTRAAFHRQAVLARFSLALRVDRVVWREEPIAGALRAKRVESVGASRLLLDLALVGQLVVRIWTQQLG